MTKDCSETGGAFARDIVLRIDENAFGDCGRDALFSGDPGLDRAPFTEPAVDEVAIL